MTTTKHTLDINNPPRMSDEAKARYDAITDDEIDYSDIPELTDDFFEQATRPKERVTVRFDADVVDWFKASGGGYQTRMNAVLRAFYEKNRPHQR